MSWLKGLAQTAARWHAARNRAAFRCLSTGALRPGAHEAPDGYEHVHLDEGDGPLDTCAPLDNTQPLSAEKRAKLALKYNLRPDDYAPMNREDFNMGDYPALPVESALERDPHYDWDDPFNRRNHGEPVMLIADDYSPTRLDRTPFIYDRPQMWKVWCAFYGALVLLCALGEVFYQFPARAPKQYPEHFPHDDLKLKGEHDIFVRHGLHPKIKDGKDVVHYTFAHHKWHADGHFDE